MWNWIVDHIVELIVGAFTIAGAIWAGIKFHFTLRGDVANLGKEFKRIDAWVQQHIEETDPLRREYEAIKRDVGFLMRALEELRSGMKDDRLELLGAMDKLETRISEEIIRLRGRNHELANRVLDLKQDLVAEIRRFVRREDDLMKGGDALIDEADKEPGRES